MVKTVHSVMKVSMHPIVDPCVRIKAIRGEKLEEICVSFGALYKYCKFGNFRVNFVFAK